MLYRMNRYWWDAQTVEQDFDDRLSQVWIKLGLARYPLVIPEVVLQVRAIQNTGRKASCGRSGHLS